MVTFFVTYAVATKATAAGTHIEVKSEMSTCDSEILGFAGIGESEVSRTIPVLDDRNSADVILLE